MMLDKMLIKHCSPTLGKLKTAGLFNFAYTTAEELDNALAVRNKELNLKGVSLHVLSKSQGRALIYVCRVSMLAEDLMKSGVQEFLRTYGYHFFEPQACIQKLKEKIQNYSCFPHEIGLFLGYPLEDVKGFIENAGKNYKCVGYWKIYGNEYEKIKLFMKYKRCQEIYTDLFENHVRSVFQLTVAVS